MTQVCLINGVLTIYLDLFMKLINTKSIRYIKFKPNNQLRKDVNWVYSFGYQIGYEHTDYRFIYETN